MPHLLLLCFCALLSPPPPPSALAVTTVPHGSGPPPLPPYTPAPKHYYYTPRHAPVTAAAAAVTPAYHHSAYQRHGPTYKPLHYHMASPPPPPPYSPSRHLRLHPLPNYHYHDGPPACAKNATRPWCLDDHEYPSREVQHAIEYHYAAVAALYKDVVANTGRCTKSAGTTTIATAATPTLTSASTYYNDCKCRSVYSQILPK